MKTTVARIYRFRAVHSLPGFPEPWCFPHQHDYTVQIVVRGGTDTDILDAAWERTPFRDGARVDDICAPSTVEALAEMLLGDFREFGASSVTVWEDRARSGKAML